jgi:hypothetical protein
VEHAAACLVLFSDVLMTNAREPDCPSRKNSKADRLKPILPVSKIFRIEIRRIRGGHV